MDRRRAEPAELTGKKIRDAISDAGLGGKDAAIGKNDLCIGQKRTLAHARKETKRRLIPKSAGFFLFLFFLRRFAQQLFYGLCSGLDHLDIYLTHIR